ncbi:MULTISPECIES: hypothetical protein [Streptomyces]|uniref:Uncharacterized protein n=1 Tax=Streptomyces edwardsiae TaxID=3075527 RepID=A0ABU2Q202_9ACTN|nr:hypothetical protein [Streptomyces sp. DSM 41636]MDT0397954.1 hypothetical protein [Streptomyces sp. DSM 41636]
MRQTRIEKSRRPSRSRHPYDDPSPLTDPRDPDIVRAKRLRARAEGRGEGGTP